MLVLVCFWDKNETGIIKQSVFKLKKENRDWDSNPGFSGFPVAEHFNSHGH